MSNKKLTRSKLRRMIREEAQRLRERDAVDEAEVPLELLDELSEQLRRLERNLDRHAVNDIANDARYHLTPDGMRKFTRLVMKTNEQIHQAMNL